MSQPDPVKSHPSTIQINALGRTLILALFILSMLGPWTFDLINVPAQYPCDTPFVRLYGDFCGLPLSGFTMIKLAAGGLFSILSELVEGRFAAGSSLLIFLTGILVIVLPFFSTLLLLVNRNSSRRQIIHVVVWALACLPTLTLFIFQISSDQSARFFYLLWGLWLYILVAISTVLFEILALRVNIVKRK
jgi:hypothetical protein